MQLIFRPVILNFFYTLDINSTNVRGEYYFIFDLDFSINILDFIISHKFLKYIEIGKKIFLMMIFNI